MHHLQSLEVQYNYNWKIILNYVSLISSPSFRQLTIEASVSTHFTEVLQIASALAINPVLKHRPVNVDIRCPELILILEYQNGSFQVKGIKGFKLVDEKIKTH